MANFKSLLKNLVVFSIGNIASKLIVIVLVPVYTHYLTKFEYGTIDLITITVQMFLPLIALSTFESVLRFSLDKEYDSIKVFHNSVIISLITFAMFVLLFPLFIYQGYDSLQTLLFYGILLSQIILELFSKYTRGLGFSKQFVIGGILTTMLSALLSILFVVYLRLGIEGYLMAILIANIASIPYFAFKRRQIFSQKWEFNRQLSKRILHYSIPLIPNNIMWWLIHSSSRMFISFFLGISANGLFAVSSKIPAVINMVSQIFLQAYQLSAFDEYDNDEGSDFSAKLIDVYMEILFIGTSVIIVFLKPLFKLLFSASYFDSWKPVPFLILGSSFAALFAYYGVVYTSAKQTKGVFSTSVYGGLISLLLNVLLIPKFGIVGAGISSMISFYMIFLIRYFDTKKLMMITVKWRKFNLNLVLVLIQIAILFCPIPDSFAVTLSVLILILNREFYRIGSNLLSTVKKKKK